MSSCREELERILDSMSRLMDDAADSVDIPELKWDPKHMASSMMFLSDTIHQRLASLPDATHIRMSRVNMVALSKVISNWAMSLNELREEHQVLVDAASAAVSEIKTHLEDFDDKRKEALELLNRLAPELDISRELNATERS